MFILNFPRLKHCTACAKMVISRWKSKSPWCISDHMQKRRTAVAHSLASDWQPSVSRWSTCHLSHLFDTKTNNSKLLFWQESLFLPTFTAHLTVDTFIWANTMDCWNSTLQRCYGIHGIMTNYKYRTRY